MDENSAIGLHNTLPWHLPDDFAMFKRVTLHHPIIMGRKTFESLGSKILPKRLNIVVSNQALQGLQKPDCVVTSLAEAIGYAQKDNPDEVFIIGGAQIFREAIPQADRLYITQIHATVAEADTFFPAFNPSEFSLTKNEFHPVDDRHTYPFTFQVWERNH
jgi:dihydrofolate reductase